MGDNEKKIRKQPMRAAKLAQIQRSKTGAQKAQPKNIQTSKSQMKKARKKKPRTRKTKRSCYIRTNIPTNEETLALLQRMKEMEPGLPGKPPGLRKTLSSELGWKIGRSRLARLWREVWDVATEHEKDDVESETSVEVKNESLIKPEPDDTIIASNRSVNGFELVNSASMEKYDSKEAALEKSIALTTPSDMELMVLLWDIEQEHTDMKEDPRALLQFIIQFKNWKVSEGRLHKILDDIEEANADAEFDTPTSDAEFQASAGNGLNFPGSPNAGDTLAEAHEAVLNALLSPSSIQAGQPLREILRIRVGAQKLKHADKITDMLLGMEDEALVALIADGDALKFRIEDLSDLYDYDEYMQPGAAVEDTGLLASEDLDDSAPKSPVNIHKVLAAATLTKQRENSLAEKSAQNKWLQLIQKNTC